MKSSIKSIILSKRTPVILGFILSCAVGLGGFGIIQSLRYTDQQGFSFDLYRLSVEIIDALESQIQPMLPEQVLGFVMLGGRGEVLVRQGVGTGTVPVRQPNGFWNEDGVVIYHRQLGGGGVGSVLRGDPGGGRQFLLWYDSRDFDRQLMNRDLVLFGGLFFLCILIFLAGFLTQRLLLAQERINTNKRLVLLGQAARTISHEIQNPLAAIDLHRQLAQRKADQGILEHFSVMEAETKRIRIIISQVRSIIQPETGSPRSIELVSWINEFVRNQVPPEGQSLLFKNRRPGHGHENQYEDKQILCCFIDPLHLQTILQNLVSNGFQSQGEKGSMDPVEIGISLKGQKITIHITDHGLGLEPTIDPEVLFDPFYTTKTQGTGLGLSMARSLAQHAGGSLRLIALSDGCIAELVLPKISCSYQKDDVS